MEATERLKEAVWQFEERQPGYVPTMVILPANELSRLVLEKPQGLVRIGGRWFFDSAVLIPSSSMRTYSVKGQPAPQQFK